MGIVSVVGPYSSYEAPKPRLESSTWLDAPRRVAARYVWIGTAPFIFHVLLWPIEAPLKPQPLFRVVQEVSYSRVLIISPDYSGLVFFTSKLFKNCLPKYGQVPSPTGQRQAVILDYWAQPSPSSISVPP